jgi:hypothetical protein
MSKLNKDILFIIFEELQDDSKSLFSCLMVNKLWCETIVPILWKNPWHYNINYSNKNYLFAIIAFYLSDDIKDYLTTQGVQLPTVSSQSLLFDYLSFCRSINVNTINIIISIGSSLDYNQFLLQQEFYSLFMKKFPELKYLDIKSIKHQVFYFPEAKTRFESLCELKCDTSIDSSYFYGLARICQSIQKLIIVNVNSKKANYGIVKLTEVQKNLKYFEWIDDFDVMDYITDHPYKDIFLVLEKKAHILKHLKLFFLHFDGVDYRFKLLEKLFPKLHNLKTLITNDFNYENENLLVYSDLEILKIDYITIYEASIIIENSGGHLKEISLKPFDFLKFEIVSDDSLNFIRKIYEKCPLIEYLSLAFSSSEEHFTELEKMLEVCQKLKSLLLITSNFFKHETEKEKFENGEELLKVLIRSAPTNLREIRFFSDFKFSLEVFEEFLEKWRGRPALSILTTDSIYEGEDYKKLINNYKNDGVIKAFRYDYITSVEDMDFEYE